MSDLTVETSAPLVPDDAFAPLTGPHTSRVCGPVGQIKPDRRCEWCRDGIHTTARRDAKFCSQRCRQAAHRFRRDTLRRHIHEPDRPMRWAYADPPYPGMAHLYEDHPDFAGEVDHLALLRELSLPCRYDGWALSTSASALPGVLAWCAELGIEVRVAVWVRGARNHERPHGPLSSWEPVVYHGGRHGQSRIDSLVHGAKPRSTDPDRVVGAKPAVFARWLFELLGAAPGDRLDDLFPGSGGIGRAWNIYTSPDVAHDASAPAPHDGSPVAEPSCVDDHDASRPGQHDTSEASTDAA